jgi:NitT/TauT family transport system substrate-binding protein
MLTKRIAAILVLAPLLTGCSVQTYPVASSSSEPALTPVSIQLNWYPETEHGGVYQAAADGTFEEAGLEVDIRPGGRATPVAPELSLGRVQFAVANADDVIVYRGQGMDIVAVAAPLQNNPRCILVRQESGAESFDDLAGMTLQRHPGRPFLLFMESQGVLEGVNQVPYHGSVSSLVADPKIAIQAYSFAEPLLAEQQGVQVRRLMVSDLGWNPYSSVLVTTGDLIRSDPELVRTVVHATRRGWQNYLTDPAQGNAAILEANEHGMTSEALVYGSRELVTLALPDDLPIESVGMMTLDRWTELVDQFKRVDAKAVGSVRAEDCFTTEFLQ